MKLTPMSGCRAFVQQILPDIKNVAVCCGRGSLKIEHTLAQNGSRKLWELMHDEPYVHSLGALTGMQAMQMVKGGLKAIYCSGWQVAADANAAAQVRGIKRIVDSMTFHSTVCIKSGHLSGHLSSSRPPDC